ncbi:hypothetical protein PGT21_033675 [Puccinia graminis f. sp. tritici]|uniref:Uncharacterized protein n=1 Tax=Puccinia graminis f. sp. tritici TaxID=56615 RepID=A0A5B0LM03_PUCGR|nr:hypothetical protein PGTUg99_015731 [Puccinia graminis f. sp. tritici]KAA1094967.1 hypothetical protein PGT21_033675 [Puccinia graminis f. sp. tritici]
MQKRRFDVYLGRPSARFRYYMSHNEWSEFSCGSGSDGLDFGSRSMEKTSTRKDNNLLAQYIVCDPIHRGDPNLKSDDNPESGQLFNSTLQPSIIHWRKPSDFVINRRRQTLDTTCSTQQRLSKVHILKTKSETFHQHRFCGYVLYWS